VTEPILLVHGGAGAGTRGRIGSERAEAGLAALRLSLRAGTALLSEGRSALDAAVAAVRVLEDAEELNAGRGAALTEEGSAELSAAVADGATRRFGGAAVARGPRNPVELARRVLEDGRHVLMAGPAADELARRWGLRLEQPEYFVTERQRQALDAASSGTVGAVALDERGHVAAATSTGGIGGQRAGRVGDSPIPGAGTWADDGTCAVSATGEGEAFLRAAFAHEVHALIRHAGAPIRDACEAALGEVAALGATGGCVAVDRTGAAAMPFTSEAMFRGWSRLSEPHVGLDPGECPEP
jgi:isoaspartyl peptidase/L-asparaginase-like protein (Ntn-hydrolase superfamily)